MRLTKAAVEGLSCPADRNEFYVWDDALKGFGLKLNPGGSRNFLVQYRSEDGRSRRVVIGKAGAMSVDEARKQARTMLAKIQTGSDPRAEKAARRAQAAVTLEVVANAYLRDAKGKLKAGSYDQVHRHLKKNWQPLAARPIADLRRADVASHLASLSAGGHRVNANRARSALSAMFAWAIGEGIAESNPVIGTNKPAEERSRERVLSEAELRAVWAACRDDAYSRIVRLLLLTAQRRDEVGCMTDSELDLPNAMWTVPGERTKNGVTHEVPLARLALDILADQPRIMGRQLVFGQGAGGFSGWSNSKERIDRRIAAAGLTMPRWTLHDLRRTAATMMAERLAVPPHVIEAILNHVSGHKAGVSGIYNRASYRAEKREALDRWARHVAELVR
jgi:integrase